MSKLTWADLAYSLGQHLASMPEDATFTLYVDEQARPGFDPDLDGYPRYVQFCAYEGGMLRCEVVSNTYLPPDMQHSIDDLIAMRADGWTLPDDEHVSGSPNLYVDIDADDAAEVAAMVVRVFQDVWHVADAGGVRCDAAALRGRHAFRVLEAPDAGRGTCPRCSSTSVRHLVIGLPMHPLSGDGTPEWVRFVGCIHPGYDRECGDCGLGWTSGAENLSTGMALPQSISRG